MVDKNTSPASPAATAAPDSFPVSLDEFCQRHSKVERSVELLAAFHHTETAAGRGQDMHGAFEARLQTFRTRPVA